MEKRVIVTIDEMFEKARKKGAKDIKKRKRRGGIRAAAEKLGLKVPKGKMFFTPEQWDEINKIRGPWQSKRKIKSADTRFGGLDFKGRPLEFEHSIQDIQDEVIEKAGKRGMKWKRRRPKADELYADTGHVEYLKRKKPVIKLSDEAYDISRRGALVRVTNP